MQDRFLKQKIFGTMGCVAITLLCVLFYMFGRSMLDEQKEKELRAKETLESVRSRLDLCHSQLQRHSSDIGQTDEIKKTLATEIHLMEMENSLLSQTNQEQLASTAECESDVNTETARRDDDDVSQQLKERILYETEQLKLQSQAIRKDKKNTTKNWRNYADALRLENVELRQRYAVISEAAKKKSEKADEEADIPVKKTKHQAEAEAEAEEEVHDAKTAGDALPSKGTRKQLACVDSDYECPSWAASGECKDNPAFMKKKCRKSCNLCAVQPPPRKGSRRGRSASRAGASESQAEDA